MIDAAKYAARKMGRNDLIDSHSTHKLAQFAGGLTNENLKEIELSAKYKVHFERLPEVSKKLDIKLNDRKLKMNKS